MTMKNNLKREAVNFSDKHLLLDICVSTFLKIILTHKLEFVKLTVATSAESFHYATLFCYGK